MNEPIIIGKKGHVLNTEILKGGIYRNEFESEAHRTIFDSLNTHKAASQQDDIIDSQELSGLLSWLNSAAQDGKVTKKEIKEFIKLLNLKNIKEEDVLSFLEKYSSLSANIASSVTNDDNENRTVTTTYADGRQEIIKDNCKIIYNPETGITETFDADGNLTSDHRVLQKSQEDGNGVTLVQFSREIQNGKVVKTVESVEGQYEILTTMDDNEQPLEQVTSTQQGEVITTKYKNGTAISSHSEIQGGNPPKTVDIEYNSDGTTPARIVTNIITDGQTTVQTQEFNESGHILKNTIETSKGNEQESIVVEFQTANSENGNGTIPVKMTKTTKNAEQSIIEYSHFDDNQQPVRDKIVSNPGLDNEEITTFEIRNQGTTLHATTTNKQGDVTGRIYNLIPNDEGDIVQVLQSESFKGTDGTRIELNIITGEQERRNTPNEYISKNTYDAQGNRTFEMFNLQGIRQGAAYTPAGKNRPACIAEYIGDNTVVVVQDGENLNSICKKFNVTPQEILETSGIKADQVSSGSILLIPKMIPPSDKRLWGRKTSDAVINDIRARQQKEAQAAQRENYLQFYEARGLDRTKMQREGQRIDFLFIDGSEQVTTRWSSGATTTQTQTKYKKIQGTIIGEVKDAPYYIISSGRYFHYVQKNSPHHEVSPKTFRSIQYYNQNSHRRQQGQTTYVNPDGVLTPWEEEDYVLLLDNNGQPVTDENGNHFAYDKWGGLNILQDRSIRVSSNGQRTLMARLDDQQEAAGVISYSNRVGHSNIAAIEAVNEQATQATKSAQNTLNSYQQRAGWIDSSVDALSALWFSNNRKNKVQADINQFRRGINKLKTITDETEFAKEFERLFGIKFDPRAVARAIGGSAYYRQQGLGNIEQNIYRVDNYIQSQESGTMAFKGMITGVSYAIGEFSTGGMATPLIVAGGTALGLNASNYATSDRASQSFQNAMNGQYNDIANDLIDVAKTTAVDIALNVTPAAYCSVIARTGGGFLAQTVKQLSADVAFGAGVEYVQTGEITASGTLLNAGFSLAPQIGFGAVRGVRQRFHRTSSPAPTGSTARNIDSQLEVQRGVHGENRPVGTIETTTTQRPHPESATQRPQQNVPTQRAPEPVAESTGNHAQRAENAAEATIFATREELNTLKAENSNVIEMPDGTIIETNPSTGKTTIRGYLENSEAARKFSAEHVVVAEEPSTGMAADGRRSYVKPEVRDVTVALQCSQESELLANAIDAFKKRLGRISSDGTEHGIVFRAFSGSTKMFDDACINRLAEIYSSNSSLAESLVKQLRRDPYAPDIDNFLHLLRDDSYNAEILALMYLEPQMRADINVLVNYVNDTNYMFVRDMWNDFNTSEYRYDILTSMKENNLNTAQAQAMLDEVNGDYCRLRDRLTGKEQEIIEVTESYQIEPEYLITEDGDAIQLIPEGQLDEPAIQPAQQQPEVEILHNEQTPQINYTPESGTAHYRNIVTDNMFVYRDWDSLPADEARIYAQTHNRFHQRSEVWAYSNSLHEQVYEQGTPWKIHLFADSIEEWAKVADIAIPYLEENGLMFKTVCNGEASLERLRNSNGSGSFPVGTQRGKAFTIYFKDEAHFIKVANELGDLFDNSGLQSSGTVKNDAQIGSSGFVSYRHEGGSRAGHYVPEGIPDPLTKVIYDNMNITTPKNAESSFGMPPRAGIITPKGDGIAVYDKNSTTYQISYKNGRTTAIRVQSNIDNSVSYYKINESGQLIQIDGNEYTTIFREARSAISEYNSITNPNELVRVSGNEGQQISQNYIQASSDLREHFNSAITNGTYAGSYEEYVNTITRGHQIAYAGKKGDCQWYGQNGRGGRIEINPGSIRHEESTVTMRSRRQNESLRIEEIAKRYGDQYSFYRDSTVYLPGIPREGLPHTIANEGLIYPNSQYLPQYFKQMQRTAQEAIELINHGASENEILSKIAEHYQYSVCARPFGQINNSLFMNEINTLLQQAGLSKIPHGMLDFAAQRMQPETFRRYFIDEYYKTKL